MEVIGVDPIVADITVARSSTTPREFSGPRRMFIRLRSINILVILDGVHGPPARHERPTDATRYVVRFDDIASAWSTRRWGLANPWSGLWADLATKECLQGICVHDLYGSLVTVCRSGQEV